MGVSDKVKLIDEEGKPLKIEDGQLVVKTTLFSGDIEIGAVEIKDQDTNIRAKIDSDNTLRTGLYDKTGARVNPSSEDTLSAMNGKMDVNLSEAGKEYLYNSTDAKSIYDRLVEILNQLDVALSTRSSEATLSAIQSLLKEYEINEVDLSPYSTGSVTDNLSIADTAKPATPQISVSHSFPASDSNNVTLYGTSAVIQIKKFAGRVEMHFTNTDSASSHTIYYQIYLDGTLVVDNSAGTSIGMSGTLDAVETIKQSNPADGDLTVDIYLWADTANVITLDYHQVDLYVGTELTSEDEVIDINRDGVETIAVSFDGTDFGGTKTDYTWALRSQASNVKLNYLTNGDLYSSDLMPKTKVNLYGSISGEYAYVTGVSALKKEV